MFDPRSPYHRRMWHYDSDRPLSIAQLVALGSLDARTAALLWLLIDRHQSLIVSGPTDPTPGVGKTTTLNALLGFLPPGSTMVYTTGMYEDFDFVSEVPPETTCVLANEVSDHLSIYMWGRVARRLLRLPEDGFAIATSCHADTVSDVLRMLARDLKLPADVIGRLGIIINIGLVGSVWPQRRRFLTVNFVRPTPAPVQASAATDAQPDAQPDVQPDAQPDAAVRAASRYASIGLLPLATWDEQTDTVIPATDDVLGELAGLIGLDITAMNISLDRRTALLTRLSEGRGVGVRAMREAVDQLIAEERGEGGAVTVDEADDEQP